MTANITYRLGVGTPPGSTTVKGAPLNNTEIDGNFKSILNDVDLKAPIDSPTFTTTAAAPTPAAYDSTTKIATTQYVQSATIPLASTPTAGKFDLGATTPSGTTRLNYGGAFWPTSLNLTGTTVSSTGATHYYFQTGDGVVRPKALADVKTEIVTKAIVEGLAITTTGIIASGTWNASTIGIAYGGTGQTTAQGAMNTFAGGTTVGQYLRGNGTNVVMSTIQAGDVPVLNQSTSGTATNAVNLDGTGTAKTAAIAGSGYGLWNSAAITYGTMMAQATDITYGGRIAGDTTSDYNMYFTMNGGVNRGFVFRSAYGSNLFSINPTGIFTGLAITGTSFNSITGLSGVAGAALAASGVQGVATTAARADHTHAFPTAANVGLGNVTNESKATMFTNPTFTGTVTGVTATAVGLGNVTNESKATMFTSPAFTGTTTAVNLTLTGDLTVGGTTTAINATNLNVADLNITVGSGAINQAQSNGAGLTIGNYASNPTLLYGSAGNDFTFNRAVLGTSFNSITGLSGVAGAADAAVGGIGVSTAAARADHNHPFPTAANVGLGNVTNESKATMFTSPTFTGTVSGVTAAMVGAEVPLTFTGSLSRVGNSVSVTVPSALPTPNAITFNSTGAGAVSGTTFNGSAGQTISYNTIGAQPAGSYQVAGSYESPLTFTGGVSRSVNTVSITYGTTASTVCQGNDSRLSDARPAADVYAWAKAAVAPASGATLTDDNSSNVTQYIGMSTVTSGAWLNAYVASTKLTFNPSTGIVSATGFNSTSDERAKENIRALGYNLQTVLQLTGKKFEMKDSGTTSIGLIAQEVQKVVPEVVCTTDVETGMLGVNYPALVALLIESIKELNIRIEALENK